MHIFLTHLKIYFASLYIFFLDPNLSSLNCIYKIWEGEKYSYFNIFKKWMKFN